MPLIEFTPIGLYCPRAEVYIDPWRGVERAIITHAHSDHARWGSKNYLCHTASKPILELRLGANNHFQTLGWGEEIYMNGVKISLHPAGHIIGSSQVRLEYKGEVWVFTGDYKLEDDRISSAWEPLRCNTFITESTFGLPIYTWQPQELVYQDIRNWITGNKANSKSSVLIAYSLGKAQRVLKAIEALDERVFVHGAIWNLHQVLVANGWKLPPLERITPDTPKADLKGAIVIAPPSADGTPWMKKFGQYSVGVCSGWMQVRGNARRRNVDRGFVLSDHCDWTGLLTAVKATGAEKVFTTHGFTSVFSRYLNEIGIWSAEVKTEFGEEGGNEELGIEDTVN